MPCGESLQASEDELLKQGCQPPDRAWISSMIMTDLQTTEKSSPRQDWHITQMFQLDYNFSGATRLLIILLQQTTVASITVMKCEVMPNRT